VERRGDMKVTLSKLIPAKRESDDPAAGGLRFLVISLMGGFLEEENNLILINGGDR
jgi:hypothetical protein